MYEYNECVDLLERLVAKNHFVQKAIDQFWCTFSYYKQEEPEEYQRLFGHEGDCIKLYDTKISLEVRKQSEEQSLENDYIHFVIKHNTYFKGRQIGYYKVLFTLEGEYDDDVLYFD